MNASKQKQLQDIVKKQIDEMMVNYTKEQLEKDKSSKQDDYIPPYIPNEDHKIVEAVYKAPEIRLEKYIQENVAAQKNGLEERSREYDEKCEGQEIDKAMGE